MADEHNLRGGVYSSHAYVMNRRRCINQHIETCEPSGNSLRDLQSRIDRLRAVSVSPGGALRGILHMMVENIDHLEEALAIQLHELGDDQRLEQERTSIHRLFSEIARIREGTGKALAQLPALPRETECVSPSLVNTPLGGV